jgi:hypothetical protein
MERVREDQALDLFRYLVTADGAVLPAVVPSGRVIVAA